jgi:capsid protein
MAAGNTFFGSAKAFMSELITGKPIVNEKKSDTPKSEAYFPTSGTYRMLYAGSFNGEKNLGEMGPVKYYLMDYYALSLRSWQAYIESPVAQTVLNKFCTWVIGKGLKLQCEPIKEVISNSKINLKEFSDTTESRFKVYADSKMADYSNLNTLNQLSNMAYKNAIIGGDVLVILRYIDDCVKVQLVDGSHLLSPVYGSEWFPMIQANGNRVVNGVEIDARGQHVAYYVRKPFDSLNPINSLDVQRVPCKGKKSEMVTAFLVYGLKFRLDNHRGIPLLTAVLEKLKTLERYDTATLSSAEEQAKLAYQIVHELGSTGEFPMAERVARARDQDWIQSDLPATETGEELASKVMATTDKQIVNNPQGAEIKPFKSNESQLYYKDYLDKNIDIVCACIEIPPNVAMSKYDSNYSASRAAVKDWEHTLSVKRKDFAVQFLQPIYDFWLEIEILKNNITAPGYLLASDKKDAIALAAYRNTRWVGAPVANIDPAKEVQAERLKLGITAESIPLTTVEAATEILNGGDSDHNMQQYADELQISKDLGLKPEPEVQQTSNVSDK